MSGIVLGSVDHVTNTSSPANSNQELFTNIYRFFNGPLRSGSYVDLVALQFGFSGGGTNFHDETNSFGENAFALFRVRSGSLPGNNSIRAFDYYILFQWADAMSFGSSPGSPGVILNGASTNDGVAVQVAWRDDGLSPWNGTTLANGNDSRGSPVWTAGTSSLHVFPRSNNVGGTHNALKQNFARLYDLAVANRPYRYHMLMDRDTFIFLLSDGDDASYDSHMYIGAYEPISGILTGSGGSLPMPLVQIGGETTALSVTMTYGNTSGSTAASQGGIVGPVMTAPVRGVRMDRYSNNLLQFTSLQPNPQFTPTRFDEFKIPVMLYEVDFGHVGYLQLWTEILNSTPHSTTSGSTKAVFGTNSGPQIVVPWKDVPPGSTSTRTGRQF